MQIRRFLTFLVLGATFTRTFAQTGPGTKDNFAISKGDFVTSVSSDDLSFNFRLIKPSTTPQTSDPGTWKIIKRSSLNMLFAGIPGTLQSVVFKTNIGHLECEIWISETNDLLAFRQTFFNKSGKSVRLNHLTPFYAEGKDFSFGPIQDWRILEQFRHKNDLPKTEIPGAGKSVACDPFLIINNNKGNGKNLFIGYQTFYLHLADISISFDQDLRLGNISANCDFEGVTVPADGTRTSQWVVVAQGTDAGILIDDYTQRIRAFYGVNKPPENAPSVYCTWYYHADNYNEEIFKKDIDHFRREHMPFDVFLIDECWDVNDWGDFEANRSFPDGMKWAASQIKSAGYTPGIWSAPFLADEESDLAKTHPGWLLKNSKGVNCTFSMNNRDHFILDLTFPGVCDYLEEQFRKISGDWGYSYFKFDFMRAVFLDSDQKFYDKSATSLEAYRRGLEAIRRGTGNDVYISVCGGHYGASFGIANTQRSGSDVKSEWKETELPKYRQNILRTWMAGLWHVDPDAMMVRRQLKGEKNDTRGLTTGLFTDDEAYTNAVNQFIGGGLITFTEDFNKIDPDRKMLYKYVIPSVNSSSRPIDLFNTTCPEIMVTPITPKCRKMDNWKIMSVVNWANDAKSYDIRLDSGITGDLKGDRFLIFDFRSQEILAWLSKGEILKIKEVAGHHSLVLKIVPWDGRSAMFIGTDLNFSCGGLEISDINYHDGQITGLIDTPWYVPIKLSFVVPSGEGYLLKQAVTSPGQNRFLVEPGD